jgi:hypothetical protein
MDDIARHGRRSTKADPALDRKLSKLSAHERTELLERLVRRHAPNERGYGEEESKRAAVLAVLFEFPRASYSALATLLYGADSLENRLKVAGHANQLGAAGKLRKVARGAWEPGPKHPARLPKR